jgi:RNAse (barnase) inhibitor barstar
MRYGLGDVENAVVSQVVITIDGQDFSTLEEFYQTIGRIIIGSHYAGSGNLDWLNDILFWPCGEEMTPYTLIWRNSEESRRRLGHTETVRQMEQWKVWQFPFGNSKAVSDIDRARHGEGPTVFDWLVEVIERNSEYVSLVLK